MNAHTTRRQIARKHWEREGWPEPRDEAQERLYVLFWLGEAVGEGDDGALDSPWYPRSWTRPERWVERLIRAPSPRELGAQLVDEHAEALRRLADA